ncbi:MAG: hypothetical protein ACTSRP_22880 [Candidatus Helarchaeota archaeon]
MDIYYGIRHGGGTDKEIAEAITIDNDDNIYIAGHTSSFGAGVYDAFLLKYDSDGNLIWSRYWGDSEDRFCYGIATDLFNNIYMAVTSGNYSTKGRDVFLVKYDSEGNEVWNQRWGGSDNEFAVDITLDNENNIYLLAMSRSFNIYNKYDIVLIKFNSLGIQISYQIWGEPDTEDDSYGLTLDNGNNCYIAGYNKQGAFLLKYGCYDYDNDNLNKLLEINEYGTDPEDPDTDDDGLFDGLEINTYYTDPLNKDTDNDGLLDGAEVYTYGTNPTNNDTDNDSIPDNWEVDNSLNPVNSTDALEDLDQDGLLNIEEYLIETNPLHNDTDFDGLIDGLEVFNYSTNPFNCDSDNDNFLDGYEVAYGSNPLNSSDYPIIWQEDFDKLMVLLEGNASLIQDLISWSKGNSTLLNNVINQLDENASLIQDIIIWLNGNSTEIAHLFELLNRNATLLNEVIANLNGNSSLIQTLINWSNGNSTLLNTVITQLNENSTLLNKVLKWLNGNSTEISTLFTLLKGNATLLNQIMEQLKGNATLIQVVNALATQNAYNLQTINYTLGNDIDVIKSVINSIGITVGDTDYDGLSDLDELGYGTNLTNIDSDCDNLNDAFEIKYGTNPLDDDTDNDGYYDGIEVMSGTDPLDRNSYPGMPIQKTNICYFLISIILIGIAIIIGNIILYRLFKSKKFTKKISKINDKKINYYN